LQKPWKGQCIKMAHRSESDVSLEIKNINIKKFKDLEEKTGHDPDVWIIHLPTEIEKEKRSSIGYFRKNFSKFIAKVNEQSVICFLTNPFSACQIISETQDLINFKLWIAIERSEKIHREAALPDNHVSLLVFTKYNSSLKHNKLQIAYTYCPFCGKTTKDYGGKKHLYSPYGTLMSDVWRDITYKPKGKPNNILKRLQDLFGLKPHKKLIYLDLRGLIDCTVNRILHNRRGTINHAGDSCLMNEDCIKALSTIPDNSIDFIFSDPPYNIQKKYDSWNDTQDIKDYFSWCDNWIAELSRVLKPGRTIAIMNIPLWAVRHFIFGIKVLDFQDWIVWEGLSLPLRKIMPAHYAIICFSKGRPLPLSNFVTKVKREHLFLEGASIKKWYCTRKSCMKKRNSLEITDREPLGNLWWDIHRLKHNSRRVDHPTQLPPSLMKRLIYTFSQENEIVLDPFDGAGTTSLVAAILGRRYIGIEISKTYHNIAKQRHIDLKNGFDPFSKNNKTPKAKNSRVARLKKQKYEVAKKTLQLEVRKISFQIGRKPTREDIMKNSRYPISYFDDYFIDWGEVCGAVGDKGMREDPSVKNTSTTETQLELPLERKRHR